MSKFAETFPVDMEKAYQQYNFYASKYAGVELTRGEFARKWSAEQEFLTKYNKEEK